MIVFRGLLILIERIVPLDLPNDRKAEKVSALALDFNAAVFHNGI